jgi:hypothetical protein
MAIEKAKISHMADYRKNLILMPISEQYRPISRSKVVRNKN